MEFKDKKIIIRWMVRKRTRGIIHPCCPARNGYWEEERGKKANLISNLCTKENFIGK